MHTIEPFYLWENLYNSSEDERSPFYDKQYNLYECTNTIYNYYIHPLWDEFGSSTLYIKILYVDYTKHFAILEFIGEWNDCLYNDIMFLKRNVIETLIESGIKKFILIGENIMNFHYSDDSYYQEWLEEIEGGWIVAIGFRQHVIDEFLNGLIHYYIYFYDEINSITWTKYHPYKLFALVETYLSKLLIER